MTTNRHAVIDEILEGGDLHSVCPEVIKGHVNGLLVSRVEEGSNISTINMRVLGDDEKEVSNLR